MVHVGGPWAADIEVYVLVEVGVLNALMGVDDAGRVINIVLACGISPMALPWSSASRRWRRPGRPHLDR